MQSYIPPVVFEKKFSCPHCGAISRQTWMFVSENLEHGYTKENSHIRVSRCDNCERASLWHKETMLLPDRGNAPRPNPDMPADVMKYYEEAASISLKSPRAAAGLLRLAVQVLCGELDEGGKNINDDIKSLVAKGLPVTVQQSLDVVRVTGNNAVHPGQIDTDDPEVVAALFGLLNVIVEYMITLPTKVNNMYEALPQGSRDAIEKRDKPKT